MTQAEVRQRFISAHPGVRRIGYKGFWYRCAHCGKWCGRPGGEKAKIPDNCKMEVDHIKSWKNGGSDALYNLQPLCRTCNRSKSANSTFKDNIKIAKNNILHPLDGVLSLGRKGLRGTGIIKRK